MLYFLVIKNILLLSLATCTHTHSKVLKRNKDNKQKMYQNYQKFFKKIQMQANINGNAETIEDGLSNLAITGSYDFMSIFSIKSNANAMLYNDLQYSDPILSMIHCKILGFYQNSEFALGVCGGLHEYLTIYMMRSINGLNNVSGFILGYKDYIVLQYNVLSTTYKTLYTSRIEEIECSIYTYKNLYIVLRTTADSFQRSILAGTNIDRKYFVGLKGLLPIYTNLFLTMQVIVNVTSNLKLSLGDKIQFNISLGTKQPLDHTSMISRSLFRNIDSIEYRKDVRTKIQAYEDEIIPDTLFKEFLKFVTVDVLKLDKSDKFTVSTIKSIMNRVNLGIHEDQINAVKEVKSGQIPINEKDSLTTIERHVVTGQLADYLYKNSKRKPIDKLDAIYKKDSKYQIIAELTEYFQALPVLSNEEKKTILENITQANTLISTEKLKNILNEIRSKMIKIISIYTDAQSAERIVQKCMSKDQNRFTDTDFDTLHIEDKIIQEDLNYLFTLHSVLKSEKTLSNDDIAKDDTLNAQDKTHLRVSTVLKNMLDNNQDELADDIFQIIENAYDANTKNSLNDIFVLMKKVAKAMKKADFQLYELDIAKIIIYDKNQKIYKDPEYAFDRKKMDTDLEYANKTIIDNFHKKFIAELKSLREDGHETMNIIDFCKEFNIQINAQQTVASNSASNRKSDFDEDNRTDKKSATPSGLAWREPNANATETAINETTVSTNTEDSQLYKYTVLAINKVVTVGKNILKFLFD